MKRFAKKVYNKYMKQLLSLQNKKWIVAVSGGADSMCLLDLCTQAKLNIVVAHVNYNKRESANRDMEGVQDYCANFNIPCFTHFVTKYNKKKNFQSQARTIRYDFFCALVEQERADGILVAHHEDDVLETYYMQKQRVSTPDYYGLQEETLYKGVCVKRILLQYSKQQIIDYCIKHQVKYFEDESNQSLQYTRNRVRHEQIAHLSLQERNNILIEIKQHNAQREYLHTQCDAFLKTHIQMFTIAFYCRLEKDLRLLFLRKWLARECSYYQLSHKKIAHIDKLLISHTKHFKVPIINEYTLIYEYGSVSVQSEECITFNYCIQKEEFLQTPYFKIQKEGLLIERVSVQDSDFPLTIRNALASDKIKLRMGTKKVSRFFIDRKISKKQRKTWPVVLNKDEEIIFVCGIGCDIAHFSNNYNLFVVK